MKSTSRLMAITVLLLSALVAHAQEVKEQAFDALHDAKVKVRIWLGI